MCCILPEDFARRDKMNKPISSGSDDILKCRGTYLGTG